MAAFRNILLIASALTAAADLEALQRYTNVRGPLTLHTAASFDTHVKPFVITAAGWVTSIGVTSSIPSKGLTLSIIKRCVSSNVLLSTQALKLKRSGSARRWNATLAQPFAAGANDTLTFMLSSSDGSAIKADTVSSGDLAFSFNVSLLPPLFIVTDDDRADATGQGYGFNSGAMNVTTGTSKPVPLGSSLFAWAMKTEEPLSFSLRASLSVDNNEADFNFLNNIDQGPTVQWWTIGVAPQDAAGLTVQAGQSWAIAHTSLDTNRIYTSGVVASSGQAVSTLAFRPPPATSPVTTLTNDDGQGQTMAGTSFSVAMDLPGLTSGGLLRSIDLRTDAPLPPGKCHVWLRVFAVQANASNTAGGYSGGSSFDSDVGGWLTSNLTLPFVNSGKGAASWRSLPLPAPIPVYGPGASVKVQHECGGLQYTAGVTASDGAPIVSCTVDTLLR